MRLFRPRPGPARLCLDVGYLWVHHDWRTIHQISRREARCAPGSLAKTLSSTFATDRADRKTYIAQGWVVTDSQTLADVGPVPEGEAIIEIPEDVLKFYQRNKGEDR